MAEAPDDVPVRVTGLGRWHVGLLAAFAIGLMILACAVGTLAALLVSDLVQITWRAPVDGSELVGALWRAGR